jgi:glycosyltransferase involved in cell wall biosynthesis
MRVGINALLCAGGANHRRTGVSRYIDGLIRAMGQLSSSPDIVAYTSSGMAPGDWPRVELRIARVPVTHPAARIAWEMTALPIASRRDGLDVFHGTVNTIPHGIRAATVVTVHDLAFLRFPDQVTTKRYRYLKHMIGSSVRRADLVVTTRQDVVDVYGIDPDLVVVAPLGVDPAFRPAPAERIAAARARFGIARRYVLAVGTIEPRKNLARLVRAFGKISAEVPHDLVLAGPEGWLMDEIEDAIAGCGVPDRVRRTGFTADDSLVALYSGADVVAMPSLYEGFGLPVLEAMASGAPVLTSNVSSLPEVAGHAAVLVDPTCVESITDGLRTVLASETKRSEMRALGLQRAAQFTWERTAALTVAGYKRVAR